MWVKPADSRGPSLSGAAPAALTGSSARRPQPMRKPPWLGAPENFCLTPKEGEIDGEVQAHHGPESRILVWSGGKAVVVRREASLVGQKWKTILHPDVNQAARQLGSSCG